MSTRTNRQSARAVSSSPASTSHKHPRLAPCLAVDPGPQCQWAIHRRGFQVIDAQMRGDAEDVGLAARRACFGAIVVRYGGPVAVAIHQHRQQAAVHQPRPAGELLAWRVMGDDVDAVIVPVALDPQSARMVAAAAVAIAFEMGQILEGRCIDVHRVQESDGCATMVGQTCLDSELALPWAPATSAVSDSVRLHLP